jgi:anhydro-N-acetylmuramic acid kinase
MIESIVKLNRIAHKSSRKVIGLMSGTSLDGLDIALCEVFGNGKSTKINLLQFETIEYSNEFRDEVKTVFSKKIIDLEKLCLLNVWIGKVHAEMINKKLSDWQIQKIEIDLIASHGQTIYHAPESLHQNKTFGNGTLQIGDGDQIAVNTGIITISDFRQKHIAAGGEGAPLAAYGDFLLYAQENKSTILLNIGGISNLTYIPSNSSFENVVCSDIGPGNKLMDLWINKHFPEKQFDQDAAFAKTGKVHSTLLATLISHPFFKLPFPKTTGPELFNLEFIENTIRESETEDIHAADVMATLNKFTVDIICHAILHFVSANQDCDISISGGGANNPLLLKGIADYFPSNHVSKLPDSDAKEAILFAVLANETIAGDKKTFGNGSAKTPNVSMGKICLPE